MALEARMDDETQTVLAELALIIGMLAIATGRRPVLEAALADLFPPGPDGAGSGSFAVDLVRDQFRRAEQDARLMAMLIRPAAGTA